MPRQHSWIRKLFHCTQKAHTRHPRLKFEALEDRTAPAAGALDPSFGTGGITTTAFESSYDTPRTMLVQPDGKVILIGTTQVGTGPNDLALARYHPDGTLDDTFGDNGSSRESGDGHVFRFNTSPPGGVIALTPTQHTTPAALLPDGKILIANQFIFGNQSIELMRLNPDGTNDQSFGTYGFKVVALPIAEEMHIYSMVTQPDGKVILAGGLGFGSQELVTVRLGLDGNLDPSYDGDGVSLLSLGGPTTPEHVDLDSLGRIVVAGSLYVDGGTAFVARMLSTGAPDASFSSDGWLSERYGGTQSRYTGLTVRTDNSILVAGTVWISTDDHLAVSRITSGGDFDTVFGGGDGTTMLSLASYYQTPGGASSGTLDSISERPGGDLLIDAGNLFVRLTSTGEPVNSFGPDGNGIQALEYRIWKVGTVVQPDESLLLFGQASFSPTPQSQLPKFATAHLLPNGLFDYAYGVRPDRPFTQMDFESAAQALTPSGQIVVAGSVWNANRGDFGFVRYTPSGAFDTTLSNNPWQSYRYPLTHDVRPGGVDRGFDHVTGVATQADGKIIVVGWSGINSLGIVRYRTSGDGFNLPVDNTFNPPSFNGWIPFSVRLQADGKILVTATDTNGGGVAAVLRFLSTGALDVSFGASGIAHLGVTGSISSQQLDRLVVQPDGKIVAAVHNGSSSVSMTRLNSNGTIDTAFGSSGTVTVSYGAFLGGLDLTPSGALVLGSYNRVYQFLSTGAPDLNFGPGGYVTVPGQVGTIAADSDGKLVVSIRWTGSSERIYRLRTDGSLDTHFGTGGEVIVPAGAGGGATGVSFRNGRIIISGTYRETPTSPGSAQVASLKQYNDVNQLSISPQLGRSYTGVLQSISVTALDEFGERVGDYTGRIRFTSSDPLAILPADYTFTHADRGYRDFWNEIIFRTEGFQTITATDTATGTILGTFLYQLAAPELDLTGTSSTNAGSTFDLSVLVRDADGQPMWDYVGPIRFTSTDPLAVLPGPFTFSQSDGGQHTFTGVVLGTFGLQSVTVSGSPSDTIPIDVKNTVLNTNDSGPGSLRNAIFYANQSVGVLDTIRFEIGSGVQTIAPLSALPTITDPVNIDGTTQPGFAGTPIIELNGTSAGSGAFGLAITIGGSTIRGLVINRYNGAGIIISGSAAIGNVVAGNYIGTDVTGTLDFGNAQDGVRIQSGAKNNLIGGNTASARNVISGNNSDGIEITGSGTSGNVVSGNYIGTRANGSSVLGNTASGVFITNAAGGNVIGGATESTRNIISGNNAAGIYGQAGVAIADAAASGNFIQGNYIGLDSTGTVDLGNGEGVFTRGANTTIGGLTALPGTEAGNVISGNGSGPTWLGNVHVLGSGAAGTQVLGNLIGTNATGGVALDMINSQYGVYPESTQFVTIGGNTPMARNVISGHTHSGIGLNNNSGGTVSNNRIIGNYIGTNIDGTGAVGNLDGVVLANGATGNSIGGSTPGERNIISGNRQNGIVITGTSAIDNVVAGNFIGTNELGTGPIANLRQGIAIVNGARDNRIGTDGNGGGDEVERNVISGNAGSGIEVSGLGTNDNVIAGNYIGTNAAGDAPLIIVPQNFGRHGIVVSGGAKDTRIGTDGNGQGDAVEGNVISGNAGPGIGVWNSGTDRTIIAGNIIGLNEQGNAVVKNDHYGIGVLGGPKHTRIGTNGNGTSDTLEGNVISGNTLEAIAVEGAGTDFTVIAGNLMGTDGTGLVSLPNAAGVWVRFGAKDTRIGTDGSNDDYNESERNVFAGGPWFGVLITNPNWDGSLPTTPTERTIVAGNYIGTNASGTAAFPNGTGVVVEGGARNNRIGTDGNGVGDLAERNVISGNTGSGIVISGSGTNNNVVAGNYIGTNAAGTAALIDRPQTWAAWGILVSAGATNTRIGTDGSNDSFNGSERNVISGNARDGIWIDGAGTNSTIVAGNFIGTDKDGSLAIRNMADGVVVVNGARNTRIGTNGNGVADDLEGNVISGNLWDGIAIDGVGSDNTIIAGNYIGTDRLGSSPIPNGGGIFVNNGARFTRIGTDGSNDAFNSSERNVISANPWYGIRLRTPRWDGVLPPNGITVDRTIVAGNYIGTNATGTTAMANGGNGVIVEAGATNTRIGTDGNGVGDVAEGNLISGNGGWGIEFVGSGTSNNVVAGNIIGLSGTGTPMGNLLGGVAIRDGAGENIIGGSSPVKGNVIGGNRGYGVIVDGPTTTRNIIQNNTIIRNNGFGIELNGGGGIGFGPATLYDSGVSAETVAVGDFNRDGHLDLVASHGQNGNSVSVWLGLGDGTFGPRASYATNVRPVHVTTGDFNRDGVLDLVTANYALGDLTTSSVSVLIGNGDGTFRNAVHYATGGTRPGFVAVADFDGDGNQDLAVSNAWANNIGILRGLGDGTFLLIGTFGNLSPHEIGVGDFNRDGRLDLAVADGGGITIFTGNGNATFIQGSRYTGMPEPRHLKVGDFNSDGMQDLLVAGRYLLRGSGDATFEPQVIVAPSSSGTNTAPIVVADLNGDGALDFARADIYANTVTFVLGLGNGTFSSGGTDHAGSNGGGNYNIGSIAAGDFDGDGRIDLVTANYATRHLSVLRNRDAGTLILGNAIGTDSTGASDLGNQLGGIRVHSTDGGASIIGGGNVGEVNVIAFNGGPGLVLMSSQGQTTVRSNSIHSNAGLGIDLGGDGVTLNDAGDGDTGPNALINFPVITSATNGSATLVSGMFDCAGTGPFTVEFFASSAPDASGYGEGQRLIGTTTLAAAGAFQLTLAATIAGEWITATVTDAQGDTSEFSLAFLTNNPPMADAGGPYTIQEGDGLALDASGTFDAEAHPLLYSWDLNGDGIFGDASGVTPSLNWSDLVALGMNDGTRAFAPRVRVDDQQGGVTNSGAAALTLLNTAPSAGLAAPTQAVRQQSRSFTLTATDPSPVDQAASFTFQIDWDGNGSIDETRTGPSGLVVTHIFPLARTYTIVVTARDKDGGTSAPVSQTLTVAVAQMQGDDLAIGGTITSDRFALTLGAANGVIAILNGRNLGTFTVPGNINLFAAGGIDLLTLSGSPSADAFDVTATTVTRGSRVITGSSIESRVLNGKGGADTFTITSALPATAGLALSGNAGTDTLVAPASGEHVWLINDPNAGTLDNRAFTGIESLVGGEAADSFVFQEDGSVGGVVDGGGGTDLIDYSSADTRIIINLLTGTASKTGGISGIEQFFGGTGSRDRLIAPAGPNTWRVTEADGGTINDSLEYYGFEDLFGGAAADHFILTEEGSITGALDGNGGGDTLDYSERVSTVVVNLAAGTATATGGITGIVNVLGGFANDTLTGNDLNNLLAGGAGNDTINGGPGRDILIGGSGVDVLTGGSGSNNATSEDLLIGGLLAYYLESTGASDLTALNAIKAEWTRTDLAYVERVAHLAATTPGGLNDSYVLNGTTVFDDDAPDALAGGSGLDWFVVSLSGSASDTSDRIDPEIATSVP